MSARTLRRLGGLALGALALGVPVATWLAGVGDPLDYLRHALPPGQVPYVLSKLAGLVAFALFWVQALLALARGTPVQALLPTLSARAHRNLGLSTLGAALAHGGLFFAASLLRTGGAAWKLWLPQVGHGYFALHVSFGLVALWLLVLGAYAGWRRRSSGGALWRWVHRAWAASFVLVVVHGLGIGSESRAGAMRGLSLLIVVSLGAVALLRLQAALTPRGAARRPVPGGSSRAHD